MRFLELANIHGHTIDRDLNGDGVIIDVGCRDFIFARHFRQATFCIDPDPSVFEAEIPKNVIGINKALSDKSGPSQFYRNGESTCLIEVLRPLDHLIEPCETMTLDDLYKITGTDVDILKLDCEGAEYMILGDPNFEPIPRQITVEFHHHLAPELHKQKIDAVIENLLKNYIWKYQHESGMDNLFVRKWS